MTRRALITGGNRGIGYAIAKGLKSEGLEVIIGSRDADAGAKAAKELDCGHVQLDVVDLRSVEQAYDDIGTIDVLVNNAGVLYRDTMLDNPAHFEHSLAVMVHGTYHMIRRAAPAMIDKQYGRIVNLSSVWGSFTEGLEGPGAYAVAKAAVNAMTLTLSRELPSTVKINSVCPGWVSTRIGGEAAPVTPEQAAESIVWLATLPEDGPTGGFFYDHEPMGW